MDFQQTGLPEKQLFRDAFKAGASKFFARFNKDETTAQARYLRGPVAMARMISEHGGECHQVAVAAALAGPAVFCEQPSPQLGHVLADFSREVRALEGAPDLESVMPQVSGSARLFLQASAIMLLEQLAAAPAGEPQDQAAYTQALQLYSAARGMHDAYRLDTRFEIAAMKAVTVQDNQPHLWAAPRGKSAPPPVARI